MIGTIEDLRNVDVDGMSSRLVYVTCHSVHGDGGGGLFAWDAQGAPEDDDGTRIRSNASLGGGRWVRDGYLAASAQSALWWGVGEGDGDVSAKFQRAVDVSAASGRTLHIPRNPLATHPTGRYRVGRLVPRSYMKLSLDSNASMYAVFAGGGKYHPCWVLDEGIRDFEIKGGTWMKFDSFMRQSPDAQLPATTWGRFEDVYLLGGGSGFELKLYVELEFNRVRFSQLQRPGVHLFGDATNVSNHMNVTRFNRCRWHACKGYGVHMPSNNRDKSTMTFRDCSAEMGGAAWAHLGGAGANTVVEGMYFENNGRAAGEPDIVVDVGTARITNLSIRDNLFAPSSTAVPQKHRIAVRGKYGCPSIQDNKAVLRPGEKFVLLDGLTFDGPVLHSGAYLKRNYLHAAHVGDEYVDLLYEATNGTVTDHIVVEGHPLSPQLNSDIGT